MITLKPPTLRKYVSSGWGSPRPYRNGIHAGLDFPDDKGAPMLAAASGVVRQVGEGRPPVGKFITIEHPGGIYTRYLHNDKNMVVRGQRVNQGEQIGTVGDSGTSRSAPHVHFDVKGTEQAIARYKARYGVPKGGLIGRVSVGLGMPAETFMSGARYADRVVNLSRKLGVVFYEPPSIWRILLAMLGLGGLAYAFRERELRG